MMMMRVVVAYYWLLLVCFFLALSGVASAFTTPFVRVVSPLIRKTTTTTVTQRFNFPEHDNNNSLKTGIDALYSPPKEPPPSQIQSVVANAKSLLPIGKVPGATAAAAADEVKNKYLPATLAGLAVALTVLPESIAFSFVAKVNPLVGLWTTVALGFVAACIGGRAGICSGASGACSVVVASLCAAKGPAYLSVCAMMAGVFQLCAGVLGLGKFIRLVPHPVMLGFVNGISILMFKSQLQHFRGLQFNSPMGIATCGLTALTMALVKILPKFTSKIPPTLGAVGLVTIMSNVLKLPVTTLVDVAGRETFVGGLKVIPSLALPAVPWTLETIKTVLPYAITMATVGSIESLLTMQIMDGMIDDGKRGSTKQECIGQGAGNVASGLVGGIGGCALLGQSIINVQSGGGKSRWSGMSMALFLAAGIICAAPLLGSVPVASLVGVMLLVCQATFSWSSLRVLNKIPKLDALVIALVSIVTVQRDLAQAVLAGTIASALGFVWRKSVKLSAETRTEGDAKLYTLNGPLFFGSTSRFNSLFDPKDDPDKVILDFSGTRVCDHSALEAIHSLAESYGSMDKTLYLRHLSKDCAQLLNNYYEDSTKEVPLVIESDPLHDPVYQVAESSELYQDVSVGEATS